MSDLISRQAAIEAFAPYAEYESNRTNAEWVRRINVVLSALPSAQPDYKTDHGYMWLCPHCGLPVHSDFEECLRCGTKRPSAKPEIIRCRDCKHQDKTWTNKWPGYLYCPMVDGVHKDDFYCAYAEWRADE